MPKPKCPILLASRFSSHSSQTNNSPTCTTGDTTITLLPKRDSPISESNSVLPTRRLFQRPMPQEMPTESRRKLLQRSRPLRKVHQHQEVLEEEEEEAVSN